MVITSRSSVAGRAADGYRRNARLSSAVAAFLVLGGIAVADDRLTLDVPVLCTLGEDCFIQNYFDTDPGPGVRDYACTGASYDGHTGTDFRVVTMADIDRNVAVVAAAAGRVRAVRDGESDQILTDELRPSIRGKECGNGVVIEHGDGWETQYCHLRRGSIVVAPGDRVAAGDRLGDIGSSGLAEFPHLELAVRKDGEKIDPFTGAPADGACGVDASAGALWATPDALPAPASEDLEAGFTTGAISPDEAVGRSAPLVPPRADSPALVYFAHLVNLRAGDIQDIRLFAPDGSVVAEQTADALPRNQASYVLFVGRRTPEGGWPVGTYRGEYRLLRDGVAVIERADTIDIR